METLLPTLKSANKPAANDVVDPVDADMLPLETASSAKFTPPLIPNVGNWANAVDAAKPQQSNSNNFFM